MIIRDMQINFMFVFDCPSNAHGYVLPSLRKRFCSEIVEFTKTAQFPYIYFSAKSTKPYPICVNANPIHILIVIRIYQYQYYPTHSHYSYSNEFIPKLSNILIIIPSEYTLILLPSNILLSINQNHNFYLYS